MSALVLARKKNFLCVCLKLYISVFNSESGLGLERCFVLYNSKLFNDEGIFTARSKNKQTENDTFVEGRQSST